MIVRGNFFWNSSKDRNGTFGEPNLRPLAPKARIIPPYLMPLLSSMINFIYLILNHLINWVEEKHFTNLKVQVWS